MSALDLPTLDLSETDLNVLGQNFRMAGETTGFMQIVNHGISPELMSRAFDQAEQFFKLPLEDVSPYHPTDRESSHTMGQDRRSNLLEIPRRAGDT